MNRKIVIMLCVIILILVIGFFIIKKLNSNTEKNENNFNGIETTMNENMQHNESKDVVEKNRIIHRAVDKKSLIW